MRKLKIPGMDGLSVRGGITHLGLEDVHHQCEGRSILIVLKHADQSNDPDHGRGQPVHTECKYTCVSHDHGLDIQPSRRNLSPRQAQVNVERKNGKEIHNGEK